MKRFVFLMAMIAALISAPVFAQNFPPLTGRVVDQANLLDPAQESALSARLATLETQTQRQLVVATISDLQGYDIADYGYQLGRKWAIGGKGRNDGIILLVAPNDRKVRVEVGYGLEGTITDALSNDIIQTDILPRFKAKDFPGGIAAGTNRLITQLQLPPEEAAKVAAQASQKARSSDGDVSIGGILFWLFIFFFVILPILRSFGGGGRRYRGNGIAPVVIWGGNDWGSGGGSSWGGGGGFGGGGFSGGGGSFGGGGASGDW
jgi:uncharacterized protein